MCKISKCCFQNILCTLNFWVNYPCVVVKLRKRNVKFYFFFVPSTSKVATEQWLLHCMIHNKIAFPYHLRVFSYSGKGLLNSHTSKRILTPSLSFELFTNTSHQMHLFFFLAKASDLFTLHLFSVVTRLIMLLCRAVSNINYKKGALKKRCSAHCQPPEFSAPNLGSYICLN